MADGQKKITLFDRFKKELKFYQRILKDPRTPKLSKFFLGLAVGYALNPVDLIPDFIPVIGYMDDLIIVPGLIFIAIKLIPKKLLQEHRENIGELEKSNIIPAAKIIKELVSKLRQRLVE